MELSVHTLTGNKAPAITVADEAFAHEFREGLIHQVVMAYLAGGRAGTKAQKTRRQVKGGGAKPWRQKGTGRARAGSIRSPLWRGGGKIFAAEPRDYTQKINKKMYQRAMTSIVSELVRQDRFTIVDQLALAQPKTRELKNILDQLKLEKVLIIVTSENPNLTLAARNLIGVTVCEATRVDPVSLVGAEKILITSEAIKKLEERLL